MLQFRAERCDLMAVMIVPLWRIMTPPSNRFESFCEPGTSRESISRGRSEFEMRRERLLFGKMLSCALRDAYRIFGSIAIG